VVEQGWLVSREESLGDCYIKMVYPRGGHEKRNHILDVLS
jgi:hypothetical protein